MANSRHSIIITRPEPNASQLAAALAEHDFDIESKPLIEFVANPNIETQLNPELLAKCQLVIFVSQQAAHYFLKPLVQQQITSLDDKTIIAVGKASQEAIQEYGLAAKIPERFDSEGILQLIEQLNPDNDTLSILLICGNEGRKLLENELATKHQITRLEVYRRVGIAQSFSPITEPSRTAIIATSEQLLQLSLHQLALQQTPQMQTSDKSLLQSVAFICASSRIEDTAKSLGATKLLVAASASNDDLVKACLNWQANSATNQNEPLKQSDTMSESDQHENEIIEALELDQEPEAPTENSKKSSIIKPLFWLLLVAALGYGGYWLWNQGYFQSNVDSQNSNTELSRIVNLEKQLQQQNSQIEQLLQFNNSQNQQNSNAQQELNRQIESLQQQLVVSQRKFQSLSADATTQARDWQIAEAEYLIRQAAQKIHYSDDTASIIALLEAADQQIVASGDSNLLGLRRAISQDIAQIKSNVAIDIDGILVKLDAIQSQLKDLTLASVKFEESEIQQPVEETVEDSAWNTFKSNVKNTFSDYYKVHHYDQSVKPFINPQQADLLQQNIMLTIKTAQLSTLRHQQQSYDQSIAELTSWISEFYQKDQVANSLLEQLKLLANAQVSVQLPNKLQSLDFIKSKNQERLNQWLQTPSIEAAPEQVPDEDELGESGNIDATIQSALERMQSDSSQNTDDKAKDQDGEQQ